MHKRGWKKLINCWASPTLLRSQLEGIFNQWTKVKITDPEVKKLIQLAPVPNKEVLQNIRAGKDDALSTCFRNMTNAAFEYTMSKESQQLETTKEICLVHAMRLPATFKMSGHIKTKGRK